MEHVQHPRGSQRREPKKKNAAGFGARRAAPMIRLYCGRRFILFFIFIFWRVETR